MGDDFPILSMTIPFGDVNVVAAVAATVACMALGFVWYSKSVFGTMWMKYVGFTDADVQNSDMKKAMGLGLLATFIGNYFLAVVLLVVGTTTIKEACVVAGLVWLAAHLPVQLHGVAWERRPVGLQRINGLNGLATLLLGATVLQWWPW